MDLVNMKSKITPTLTLVICSPLNSDILNMFYNSSIIILKRVIKLMKPNFVLNICYFSITLLKKLTLETFNNQSENFIILLCSFVILVFLDVIRKFWDVRSKSNELSRCYYFMFKSNIFVNQKIKINRTIVLSNKQK